MTDIQVTQAHLGVLGSPTTNIDITQAHLGVLGGQDVNLDVTQAFLAILADIEPTGRTGRMWVQMT